MIKLAAFDIAGTTINDGNLVYQALGDCITERGLEVDPIAMRDNMGREKRAAIRSLVAAVGGEIDDAGVESAYTRFTELLEDYYRATPPTPIDGATDALARLREAGVKVALTTGFTTDVARTVLDGVGWRIGDQIDAVVCGDEVPAGRPAPYLIHRAMERTDTQDVREVIAAGDTIADLLAGTRSGASLVVGVLTGDVAEDVMRAQPHTHVVPSIVDAVELALATC